VGRSASAGIGATDELSPKPRALTVRIVQIYAKPGDSNVKPAGGFVAGGFVTGGMVAGGFPAGCASGHGMPACYASSGLRA
jgi:hypothetical protein